MAAKPPRFLDAAPPVAAHASDADEAVYVAEIVPPALAKVPASSPFTRLQANGLCIASIATSGRIFVAGAFCTCCCRPSLRQRSLRPTRSAALAATDIRREVMTGFKNAFVQSSQAYRMGLVFSTAFMLLIPVHSIRPCSSPGFLIWAVL
ncbi:MAG: hypothetical protein U0894_05195 [Pirellulales bacterium]